MKARSLIALVAALAMFLLLMDVSHGADLGPCEPATSLNGGAFNHQCMVINNVIYDVEQGGYVAYSKVEENGDLSTWKKSRNPFPSGMGDKYFSAAAYRDCIYVIGGIYSDKLTGNGQQSAMVIMSRVLPDGSLEPWVKTQSLPEPRMGGAAVAANGFIYYVGGENQRKVFFSKVNEGGDLAEWSEAHPLPSNRGFMQIFSSNNYLYVVGGLVMHQRPVDTVFRTQIKKDGSIEKWRRTETLPGPRSTYAGVLVNKDIFVFGGYDGTSQTSTAVATKIEADDHFAEWHELHHLPIEATALQAVYARKWIYLIGGITIKEEGNTVWNTVWRYLLVAK